MLVLFNICVEGSKGFDDLVCVSRSVLGRTNRRKRIELVSGKPTASTRLDFGVRMATISTGFDTLKNSWRDERGRRVFEIRQAPTLCTRAMPLVMPGEKNVHNPLVIMLTACHGFVLISSEPSLADIENPVTTAHARTSLTKSNDRANSSYISVEEEPIRYLKEPGYRKKIHPKCTVILLEGSPSIFQQNVSAEHHG